MSTGLGLWFSLALLLMAIMALIVGSWFLKYPRQVKGTGMLLMQGELGQIVSTLDGTVETWLKEEGDTIAIGDPLVVLRPHANAEQTETLVAKRDGVIAEIIAYATTAVTTGQSLAIITSSGDSRKNLVVLGFVSSLEGKKIQPRMKASVSPSITNPFVEGEIEAVVRQVGKLPMTKAAVQSVVKIPEIAKYIRSKLDAEPWVVTLSLVSDESHATGYRWTGPGPRFQLDSGILVDISITYDEPSVLALIWPTIDRLKKDAR